MELKQNKKMFEANAQITCQQNHSEISDVYSRNETSALLHLLFYSILMFTLPFGAFFGTQHLLHEYTNLSEFVVTSMSVTSAVITVYIVIALYIYKAYNEEEIKPIEINQCENEKSKQN